MHKIRPVLLLKRGYNFKNSLSFLTYLFIFKVAMVAHYLEITEGIEISVEPMAQLDSTQPKLARFAFAYTVTIRNKGESTVQLLERYWLVKSGSEPIAEVVGPGVVGEQPTIDAGGEFSYSSGAIIDKPTGSMEGRYTFRRADGTFFEATIPTFDLLHPSALH